MTPKARPICWRLLWSEVTKEALLPEKPSELATEERVLSLTLVIQPCT